MTISRKLFGGFLAVLIILTATVAIGYSQITSINSTYTDLIEDKAQKLIQIKELQIAVKQEQVSMRGYLIIGDESALQNFTVAHNEY
ncbi:CHASE3 domain-containing protein [Ammoniphilus resinae]|nr:MCP four helix bundle domain-containing protein [Ammoniphilus resinae]